LQLGDFGLAVTSEKDGSDEADPASGKDNARENKTKPGAKRKEEADVRFSPARAFLAQLILVLLMGPRRRA
jgi:hypothetical protein